ncbi:hypothetical protein [Arthrobacter sp. JSM 101049]|uniref:hypothetical protein n=1 Tax=Arthrobacter sp. JSM 101049 TaxID=929097 RepID=UPI00356675E4
MSGNLIARSVHDLSAAAWFGGSLMGAIGLNGATGKAMERTDRTRLSSLGWKKWAPVQTAAFGSHIVAGLVLIQANKGRLGTQHGVARLTTYKTIVTLTGAAVTLYAGMQGKKVEKLYGQGARGATEPGSGASSKLRDAQKRLKKLQWAIPVFAGWVIVLGAKEGEMQRPTNVVKGLGR